MDQKLQTEAPEADVTRLEPKGLQVEIEKLVTNMLDDQGSRMVASDGCITSPTGPGC